jgi:hypothetical protein
MRTRGEADHSAPADVTAREIADARRAVCRRQLVLDMGKRAAGAGLRLRTPPRATLVLATELILPTVQSAARISCSTLARLAPDASCGTTHGGGGATTVNVSGWGPAIGVVSLPEGASHRQITYWPAFDCVVVASTENEPLTPLPSMRLSPDSD